MAGYKNEGYPIKNEGARVLITLNIYFSDSQRQITPKSVVVFGRISNPSILMAVLTTCKNEEDLIRNEGARVLTTYSPLYKSIGIFPDAQGQLTPQSLGRSNLSKYYGCPC